MQFDAKTTLFAAARHKGDAADDVDAALARFLFELRTRHGVKTDLLNAFERVPRQPFLPDLAPHLLYAPIALPLPCGEEAEDPVSLALTLEALGLTPGMQVLEIGTGSGFSASLMARLGAEVTSIERCRTLVEQARSVLLASGITGVEVQHADGLALSCGEARYARILLNGAVATPPLGLLTHLGAGGFALGHTRRGAETRLTLWQKEASGRITESDFGTSRAAPLRRGLPETL